jgi:hypothetical protein
MEPFERLPVPPAVSFEGAIPDGRDFSKSTADTHSLPGGFLLVCLSQRSLLQPVEFAKVKSYSPPIFG